MRLCLPPKGTPCASGWDTTQNVYNWWAGDGQTITNFDCLQAGRQCVASLASFVYWMSKYVDNTYLTSRAGVRLMLFMYVQKKASLSLKAAATSLLLILRDRSCWFGQSSLPFMDNSLFNESIIHSTNSTDSTIYKTKQNKFVSASFLVIFSYF